MDTLPITYHWILLLDADEALTPQLAEEIPPQVRRLLLEVGISKA